MSYAASDRVNATLALQGVQRVDLARMLGCDKSSLTRYLAGRYSLEGARGAISLGNIARVLGVDESWLREGSPCVLCDS